MSILWGWTGTGPFWKYPKDFDLFGTMAKSGIRISHASALSCTAYYAGVTLISQTLAQVPLPLYRQLERGKEKAREHSLYSILHDAPNPYMSAYDFKETMQGHVVTWGNSFAEIQWEGDSCTALWPLRPDRMSIVWKDGELWYVYSLASGEQVKVPHTNILHLRGFGGDGVIGYDNLTLAREAIGLAKATEEFGARFFSNGSQLNGVLMHPGQLKDTSRKNMRESWEEMHRGLSQSHRIAILEEGVKWEATGIPPENAQFLETRKFQTSEIARFLHIPPHMIGDLEKATYSNIEHQGIEFVVYTMTPWFVRWEQAINQKLLSRADRQQYFTEFMVQGLLRGDSESRAKYYKDLFYIGAMSPNDIREKENENPIPGGDEYYVPLNMMAVGKPSRAQNESESRAESIPGEKSKKANAGLHRFRIAAAYKIPFHKAGQRIVKAETETIRRSLNDMLPAEKAISKKSINEWFKWLDDFYKDFAPGIRTQIAPAIHILAEAIQEIAASEVNITAGITPELESFLLDYAGSFSTRYVNSSKGQLKKLVLETAENQAQIVETRLNEWGETRPGKISMNETVQLSNAVAKWTFAGAGIARLQWVALGAESCPLCNQLDGKIVGIEENFVNAGAILSGGDKNFSIGRPTSHPPLHAGCVCQIVPV